MERQYESLEPSFGINKRLIGQVIVLCLALFVVFNLFIGINHEGNITVIQNPFGEFSVKSDPGVYFKWLGKTTVYKKSLTYWFDEGIPVRFNDGGTGCAFGIDMFRMPTNEAEILKVHHAYGRREEVVESLIKPLTRAVMLLTATLMSSEEAKNPFNKEKFAQQVYDQMVNGLIIGRDSNGRPLYGKNWLSEYGITVKLLEVKDLKVYN